MTETRTATYELPGSEYYLGDPTHVFSPETLQEFWKHEGEDCFLFKGVKVICVDTAGDGEFPLYDLNTNDSYDDGVSDKAYKGPVLVDTLVVDTGQIALIPAKILELGPDWDPEDEDCLMLLGENGREMWLGDEGETFLVTFHKHFRHDYLETDYVDISERGFRLLIDNKDMYPDAEEDLSSSNQLSEFYRSESC